MRFWVGMVAAYVVLLACALGSTALLVWGRGPVNLMDLLYLVLVTALLLAAVLVLTLMLARRLFPQYWWLAQVRGEDVYEYDGVYFVGLRINRVPNRIQRMVFGVDDKMRSWDMIFGVLFFALVVPHAVAGATAYRMFDRILPEPVVLYETLHAPVLSSLPVLQQLDTDYSFEPAVRERLIAELERIQAVPTGERSDEQWFQLAQLHLLTAFAPRTQVGEPFYYTPGERVFFNRGEAAKAVNYLEHLLNKPELQRADWGGGALTLLGFFHLADHRFDLALEHFQQALPLVNDQGRTGLSRWQVQLLASQAAMLDGQTGLAQQLLEQILVDDRLPFLAYALALEHFAEALRLEGRATRVRELLDKAGELYRLSDAPGGIARVQLRHGVLDLAEGEPEQASRRLSEASRLAAGLGDWFTINMVERVYQGFAG